MERRRYKCFAFFLFVFVTAAFSCNGCGFISIFGTPSRHEKKIAAEYKLGRHKDLKILVLVNQPAWVHAQANLRYHLTEKINGNLRKKVKIRREHLVSYNELSEFRSRQPSLQSLSPTEVGAALNANMVLFVMIDSCELHKIAETDYYKGSLNTQSTLRDVASGKKVWPESSESKSIKVGFEVESDGREAAVNRLASALAHCVVRYFYDCQEDKFKIRDDRSDSSWGSWEKERSLGDLQ